MISPHTHVGLCTYSRSHFPMDHKMPKFDFSLPRYIFFRLLGLMQFRYTQLERERYEAKNPSSWLVSASLSLVPRIQSLSRVDSPLALLFFLFSDLSLAIFATIQCQRESNCTHTHSSLQNSSSAVTTFPMLLNHSDLPTWP